jgi:hypothetical protein
MCEHRPDANAGRRDRGPDELPARPQDVRDDSGDRHALDERLRLARLRRHRSSRRHRDVRRRQAPRQRASTDVLARQQHRTRRRLRPRREPHSHPNANPGLNTTYVPRIGLRAPASPRPRPPSSVCALSTTAFAQGPGPRDGVSRPANVWSDPPSYAAHTGAGTGNSNGVTDGSSTTLVSLGQTLFTLFCVSVHEHAWMAGGYGVWGMERYLERFWTCLDWEAVRDSYVVYVRPKLLMLVARPHPRFRVGCAAGARLRVDRPVYMILLCSFTLKV